MAKNILGAGKSTVTLGGNPMHLRKTQCLATALLALALPASGQLHRGVWFWGSTTLPDMTPSPYGSSLVVGSSPAEDETINFFTLHGVKRVYGSYQNRPVSEPAVIATWNAKLDAAGVSSQILIDGIAVNDPLEMASILNKINTRLINFNASLGVAVASKFDALHLDLEPQGLPLWDSGTPAIKRGLLEDLLDAYVDIRALLDGAGLTAMPIYADIPFTWDKLPVDGGTVGWADAADRDLWFSDVASVLSGISIMTFSKDNFTDIDIAIDYERSGTLTGKARVGIQPKVGPGTLWPTILHFNTVMNACESAYGPTGATDLENYAYWRHAIATTMPSLSSPIVATLEGVTAISGGQPVLVFDGLPGHLYTVRYGTHPGQVTQIVRSVRTTTAHDAEILKVPVTANGPRGFWVVERISDPN